MVMGLLPVQYPVQNWGLNKASLYLVTGSFTFFMFILEVFSEDSENTTCTRCDSVFQNLLYLLLLALILTLIGLSVQGEFFLIAVCVH